MTVIGFPDRELEAGSTPVATDVADAAAKPDDEKRLSLDKDDTGSSKEPRHEPHLSVRDLLEQL